MPALAVVVRDGKGEIVSGCFYVSKYGGTDGQDMAYRWIEEGGEWKRGDDGELIVETLEGRLAVYLPDGTQTVDY